MSAEIQKVHSEGGGTFSVCNNCKTYSEIYVKQELQSIKTLDEDGVEDWRVSRSIEEWRCMSCGHTTMWDEKLI